MIITDKMKDMFIYKTKTFYPTHLDNKKKNSNIFLMTPNFESSKKLMEHPLFVNKLRYQSYYLERDVSYYIGKEKVEDIDESCIINEGIEKLDYLEETKRSELPDDAFGVPSKRKFPLDTEAHVRSAIKFFNYVDSEDEAELARRIIAAMKKYGITDVNVGEKNRFSKYYHSKATNEAAMNEAFFKNEPDIYYNKDKFDKGEINLCFITGLSGSGKSSMSATIKDKITVDLDKVIMYNYRDDDFFKAEGPVVYGFIKGPGAKYHISKEEKHKQLQDKSLTDRTNRTILSDLLKYTINYANSHKDQKIVVDGVWLYMYCNPAEFDKYAVYIKGTSAVTSGLRAGKRGSNNDEKDPNKLEKFVYLLNRVFTDIQQEAFSGINKWRNYYSQKIKEQKSLNNKDNSNDADNKGNENPVDRNPDIQKIYFVKSNNGHINACVKHKDYPKPLRGRSELIAINGNQIYLLKDRNGFCSTKKMRYNVPGGGWDPNENHMISATREAQEEALIRVTNPMYVDSYVKYDLLPMPWVMQHVNPKDWWYGYYTEIYVAKYVGKYTGEVAKEDRQDDMAKHGKFYNIDDVYDKLHPLHQKAIDMYRGKDITESVHSTVSSDYKAKGRRYLHEFSKYALSKEFIEKNKDKYGVLRHIRYDSKGYIYLDGEKLVAILAIEEKDNGEKWIQALEVAKAYQGYGLSNELIKIARSFGAEFLSVNKKNEIAIKLYRNHGFKIYDQNDTMYFMSDNPNKIKELEDKKDDYDKDVQDVADDEEDDNDFLAAYRESYKYIDESQDASTLDVDFKKKSGYTFKIIDMEDSEALKYITKEWIKKSKYGEIAICKETDELAGYIYVNKERHIMGPLRVYQKFRGYGLSNILFKDGVDKFGGNELGVFADNEVAIRLYKKYGFIETKRKKQGNNYFIIMKLKSSTNESYIEERVDEKLDINKEIIAFNKELNSWKYGVLINGKVYTKEDKIDWSKYKTIPTELMAKYHVGVCWDFVNYEYKWFKEKGIKTEAFMFVMQLSDDENDIVTHTFLLFNDKGSKYWFESSWFGHQHIVKVSGYKDVIKELVDRYGDHPYSVYKYSPEGLDKNLTNGEFFKRTTRNLVFNYEAKNESYIEEATKNKHYIFNKVYYIDDNTVVIEKGDYKVIVAKDNKYSIVFDPNTPVEDHWFNCLAHKKSTATETYEKWLHVIGKMISKEDDSKYFRNHKTEEHLTNGNCSEEDYDNIIKLQKKTMKKISSIKLNESYIEEACKDLKIARKFVTDVQKIAKKYDANFFLVTDGASGYSNGNGGSNPAVKNARNKQIEWEKENGFDPDEDWSKNESYIEEFGLPRITVPNTLYHGSNQLYNQLQCTGIDFGNSFQKPGWSLFTWTKYEKAIGWSIFATLKWKTWKYFDYEPMGCMNSSITILTSKSYKSLIENLDKVPLEDKICYVYSIDTNNKDYEFGLGHSSNTPDCITIRYDGFIPVKKVDSFIIDKKLIDKYCVIRDKAPTPKDYGKNERLFSFLMNHDMMYNDKLKKILDKSIHLGELNVGDDILAYMKAHGYKFEDISIFRRIHDKINNEEYISTDRFLSYLPESALNLGDKVIFFNEDVNDTQLKKLLYSSRIRNRKQLLEVLANVKKELPWIKYVYPDIAKYNNRNLFVDLYYYNSLFFQNNTWVMKKGLNLYSEFMNRLINKNALAGYTKKTVFIPISDWDFKHDGSVWNFRVNINPISCIYQMLYEGRIASLKKTFGNMNVIFIGSDKYFKLNFSSIDTKEIKSITAKFRAFVRKICMNEEFDLSDIDTTADYKDSPEVVRANIIDKIELAKGIDITPQVAAAVKTELDAKNLLNKKDFKGVANVAKDNTITKQTPENKKAVKKKEEETKKNDDANKSKLAKAEYDDSTAKLNKEEDEENARKLADAIAKATSDNQSEEDAMDELDKDEIKNILVSMSGSDNKVDMSPTRAARMDELNKKVLEKEVNGRSIRDILDDTSNKKEEVTKLNISGPNDEWNELKFMNFDKNYNIEKDIISIFKHFASCSMPLVIRDIKVTDSSTSEDRTMLYDVSYEDFKGKRFTIKLDIPIMEDNRFLLRGNAKSIQTQFFNMPIIKTDIHACQLISNYKKIFLYRFGDINGKSSPIVARIIKAANKYKGRKIKFTTGYNLKVSNKYQLPIDYIDLSASFSTIETERFIILFNQDDIRKKYVIEEEKGIPYAFDKKENAILYFDPSVRSFDKILYDILSEDSNFLELFDSATRPNSGAFVRASVMDSKIPLIIILGYYVGLRETLDRASINYELVEKLTKEIRQDINKDWIRFEDGYVVYSTSYTSNLLLNGLKQCSTTIFKLADIDNKNMYLEFLDNYGGRIKADGLLNFRDLFIDPMIKETLEYYKLPTDFIDVLIYGNSLLADNKYIKHTNTVSRRLRRYQIIAAYTYLVMSAAYGRYANSVRHTNHPEFSVKRSEVIDLFLTDNITSDDSCINALRDIETTNAITTKGPSGMNSDRAYSLDKRAYDESMINVLGMSTGFAGNVGITRQTTLDANVTPEGYVLNNNGNTENMNDANTLTATEALTPFGSTHDDPMRTAMTFIQTSKHSVRTEDSDPLLVTNGIDEVVPFLTTNKFAYKARMDGKIIDITDDYIIVEYKDGKRDLIILKETIEKNSDGGYYVPMKLDASKGLRKGTQFKKDQILAYDHYSFSNSLGEFDNLAYNIGKLAKVAVLNSDEGFEDSGIISSSMAKKLATRIDIKYECVIDKNGTIFSYKKVGDHVEAAENLIVYEDSTDDEDTNDILASLLGSGDISDLGKRKVESEVTGEVKGIKIFRTVELDDMSPSVRAFVEEYENPIKKLAKLAEDNGIGKDKVPATYVLPPTGKLKKSQNAIYVEIYVEYLDTVGVGDKIVYMSANKAVEKNIFPEGKEPYTEFRPNEIVDAMVSVTSINHRIVTSSIMVGAINKLMIELDRSVKDIMGIDYDDSSI